MISSHIFELFTLGASSVLAVFCFSLSRKVSRLNNLETGIGGAIAVLVSEVERLESSISAARMEADEASLGLLRAIDGAKEERQKWVLQQSFTASGESKLSVGGKRILKERRRQDA